MINFSFSNYCDHVLKTKTLLSHQTQVYKTSHQFYGTDSFLLMLSSLQREW